MRYLLALLLSFSSLLAAPTVTNVEWTGNLGDETTFTVSGSSFGTGPSVVLFDDFEGNTGGDKRDIPIISETSEAPVGGWSSRCGAGGCEENRSS